MTAQAKQDPQAVLEQLLAAARKAGADAADALIVESTSAGVSYRLGNLEDVERSESADLGLRVFVGARVAFVSSTDLSPEALAELPERAVAMARLAPEDRYAGLAPAELLARDYPALDLEDPDEPSPDLLIERARAVEAAAMAVTGVTNSEGGGASYGRNAIALATSEGFFGRYASTSRSIGVAVLAGEGTGMERDYDSASARHAADLEGPEAVGRRAGERTVARLNPRKAKSAAVPVVYDPRVASGLVGHFVGAISGSAIARGVSFLKDRMGEAVFAPGITHHRRSAPHPRAALQAVRRRRRREQAQGADRQGRADDLAARLRQRPAARPDHDRPCRPRHRRPARALAHQSLHGGRHGDARRAHGRHQGRLLCHRTDGHGRQFGAPATTAGAPRGFWIENGQIAYPVSGVTIAGNLKDMFRNLTPANDLEFRYGTNAPTLRVEGMTIAGA